MAAADAQLFWMSAKVPNDQFLLFGFDGAPDDVDGAVAELRRRAQSCGELRLRVIDDVACRFPRWRSGEVEPDQLVVAEHPGDWQGCLDAVARLDQLDARRMAWRAHVFAGIGGIPGVTGPGSVVVVQMSHALGDGSRSAALAGALLGRAEPVPAGGAPDGGCLPRRAVTAARAHRRLVRDTEAGLVPPPGRNRLPLSVNDRPGEHTVVRTAAVHRDLLPGPTVTVGALVVIAEALSGYLAERGEDVTQLGAEVPMTGPGERNAHNNFRSVGVGLYAQLERGARAEAIARELAGHRRRGAHPAMRASAAAFAAVPPVLLRWGIGQFDPGRRSAVVSGHTVVSSVNRGPADLSFGGCPVVLTAGYPALSPMMSLTHGVHGIGDVLAISVHADPVNVDVDDYLRRLRSALGINPRGRA
ncbi:MAG: DUF1298 domain-containing protein [Mycobacterium sp.]|nr:DUF1298 domain-containing protein [Mycobacterium sp.]